MRDKILMLVVAAMLMVAVAAPPALAAHGWEWTNWEQWSEGSPWWCSAGWFHDESDGWSFEQLFCYNTDDGEVWTWP